MTEYNVNKLFYIFFINKTGHKNIKEHILIHKKYIIKKVELDKYYTKHYFHPKAYHYFMMFKNSSIAFGQK